MNKKIMVQKYLWRVLPRRFFQFSFVLLICIGKVDLTGNTLKQIVPKNRSHIESKAGLPFIYEAIDTLFSKYVTIEKGLVDYYSLHTDSLLTILKDSIAHFNLSFIGNREDSLAFYINAYNVMVIFHIKDYGLISQESMGFPLFSKEIMVGGEIITLDQLEKTNPGYIAKFNDPRTHFALVCAARSCPPLLNRAYRGETLYNMLDNQTVSFINNNEFNSYRPTPSVSALFSWYVADFTGHVRNSNNSPLIKDLLGGTVNDFIASYLNKNSHFQSVKQNSLKFKAYDGTVNHQ